MVWSFKRWNTYIYFAILIFYGCETDTVISYDVSTNFSSKLVIEGFISNTEGVRVKVTHSLPPIRSDSTTKVLKGLKVKLIANDQMLFLLKDTNEEGLFLSPDTFKPIQEVAYQIEAEAAGFPTAKSRKVYLPEMVRIDTVFLVNANYITYVVCNFCDNPLRKNYYYYNHYVFASDPGVEEYLNVKGSEIYPLFFPANIFADYSFEGQCIKLQKEVYIRYFTSDNKMKLADSVKISFFNLSEEIYQYFNSLSNWDYSNDDMWQKYPPTVYTNIENGYGLFSTFSEQKYTLKIK